MNPPDAYKDEAQHGDDQSRGEGQRVEISTNPILKENGSFSGAVHAGTEVAELHSRYLLDSLNEAIMVIDRDRRVVDVNSTLLAGVGLTREDVVGRTCHEITHGRDQRCDQCGEVCLLDDVFRRGKALSVRHRLASADGTRAWVDVLMSPVLDSSGEVVFAIEAARDASEIMAVAEALRQRTREQGERVKELKCLYGIASVEAASDVSPQNVACSAIELLQKAWQYPEVTCVRMTLGDKEYCTENFQETKWNHTAELISDGRALGSLYVGYVGERPEADEGPFLGEKRHLLEAAAALLAGIVARLELATKARELDERYLRVLETAQEGVLIADVDTKRLKYANPAMHDMLSYEPGGLHDLSVPDVHTSKDLDRVLETFAAQARGEIMLAENIPFLRKDGTVILADVKTTPMVLDGSMCNIAFVTGASRRAEADAQLRRRLKFEQIISRASTEFINLRADQLDGSVTRTLATAGRFFCFDSCHARVFKADSDRVERSYDWSADTERPEAGGFGDIAWMSFGWVRAMMLEFNPVTISSLADLPPQADDLRAALESGHVRSAVAIPIMLDGDVVGTMSAATFDTEREWRSEPVSLLTTLGELIISARQREGARTGLGDTLEKQRRALDSTVRALSSLTELRDPYTAGHQRRVAEFSRAIALKMGLSAEDAEGVYVSGMLHDIGKMRIPAEILVKAGPVDELEFNVIKTHTRVGHGMLINLEFPWPVAEVALRHHERMDGSGYPDGVQGDDIPMEARIVGLADVVEAMTSYRPYRPALPTEAAVAEIRYKRGVLYDEGVVDAALTLLTMKGFELGESVNNSMTGAASGPRTTTGS
ncbi:MAG: HD domain-containing phosphohydrolase [Candidatus Eisenbacteria bacterium]